MKRSFVFMVVALAVTAAVAYGGEPTRLFSTKEKLGGAYNASLPSPDLGEMGLVLGERGELYKIDDASMSLIDDKIRVLCSKFGPLILRFGDAVVFIGKRTEGITSESGIWRYAPNGGFESVKLNETNVFHLMGMTKRDGKLVFWGRKGKVKEDVDTEYEVWEYVP